MIKSSEFREFIGKCVTRFENCIRVSRLWEITAVDEADADALHAIFRKCSDGKDGHDHSVSGRQTSPKHEDMLALLDELKTLIDSVHAKRKRIKNRRRGSKPSHSYSPGF